MLSVNNALMTYARSHADRRLLIALNMSAEPHTYDLKRSGRVLISTHLDRGGEALSDRVALRRHEGLIIALE
jgi:alpha-glucosidase